MRRHRKLIAGLVIAGLLLVGAAAYLWLNNLADPMPEAEVALASDERVTVEVDPWLKFIPPEPSDVGLVFYPGGRVPPEAYAPPMRSIAEAGYLVVVPSMPFGLAVLAPDTADGVIEAHPEVEHWVIGGHSLGGAMAAGYADGHAAIDGLALWAAYPAGGTDLAGSAITATSVFASEDGLTTLDEIDASREQMPPDTAFVEVEGGNHAGFGWYGAQDGDGVATISREEQQAQAVAATVAVLEAVDGP